MANHKTFEQRHLRRSQVRFKVVTAGHIVQEGQDASVWKRPCARCDSLS